MEKLRCPKCTSKNFYYRENKNLHYKCKKCGATAKRFGLGSIRRDKKFIDLEECPGPKKEVQTSAKKKK